MSLLVALVLAYTPQEAQALFVEANDAANRQEFSTAIDKYQRLIAAGHSGPDVLFNLGTAHLLNNELGPAVLYLTRADRLRHDDDIAAQLAVAQTRQADQVVGADEAVPFVQRVGRAVDERLATGGFLAAWWLFFGLLLLTARSPRGQRLWRSLAMLLCLVAAIALGSLVGAHAWVASTVQEGVVMPATSVVREFPAPSGKVAFEVHAGLVVRVMEDSGPFVRIRLPNALEGWVEKTSITAL